MSNLSSHLYRNSLGYSIAKFKKETANYFDRETVKKPKGLVKKSSNVSVKQFAINSDGLTFAIYYFENTVKVSNENTPVVLFFASGFDKDCDIFYRNFCSSLCAKTDSIVLLLNFLQEGILKFPSAIKHAVNTIKWLKESCPYWQINSDKIYIMGDFLAANIALSSVIEIRKYQKNLNIAGLILYDVLFDSTIQTESFRLYENNPSFSKEELEEKIDEYLVSKSQAFDKRINLSVEKDFTKFPSTVLLTSEYSILRDDSKLLEAKLKDSGSSVFYFSQERAYFGYLYSRYKIKNKAEKIIKNFVKNNDINFIKIVNK